MEQTRIIEALKGSRGQQIDLSVLEQLFVRFGQLVIDNPTIREIDINPLLASGNGFMALDARVVLHGKELGADQLPRPVIRPYPTQYTSTFAFPNGQLGTIRAIRPEDEPLLAKFHSELTAETVYRRYAHTLPLSQRVMHERLSRNCFVDYDRDIILVVETQGGDTRQIIAVGALFRFPTSDKRELALVVSDRFQRQGIGRRLMQQLIHVAKAEGIERVIAYIAAENVGIRGLCEKSGFTLRLENAGIVGVLNM